MYKSLCMIPARLEFASHLRLHDSLHVGRPAMLGGDHHQRCVMQALGHLDRHHLIAQLLLPPLGQLLVLTLRNNDCMISEWGMGMP